MSQQKQAMTDEEYAKWEQEEEYRSVSKKNQVTPGEKYNEYDDSGDDCLDVILIDIPNLSEDHGVRNVFQLQIEDGARKKLNVIFKISDSQRSRWFGAIEFDSYDELSNFRYGLQTAINRQDMPSIREVVNGWILITKVFEKFKEQYGNAEYNNSEKDFEVVCKGLNTELNGIRSMLESEVRRKSGNPDFEKVCQELLQQHFSSAQDESVGLGITTKEQDKAPKEEKKFGSYNGLNELGPLYHNSLSGCISQLVKTDACLPASQSKRVISSHPRLSRTTRLSTKRAASPNPKEKKESHGKKAKVIAVYQQNISNAPSQLRPYYPCFFSQNTLEFMAVNTIAIGAKAEDKQNSSAPIKTIEIDVQDSSSKAPRIQRYAISVPFLLWNRWCKDESHQSQADLKNNLHAYQNAIKAHDMEIISIALSDMHDCILMLSNLHEDHRMPEYSEVEKAKNALIGELHKRLKLLNPAISSLTHKDLAKLYVLIKEKELVSEELMTRYPGLKAYQKEVQVEQGVRFG